MNKIKDLSFSEKMIIASNSTSAKELLELAKENDSRFVPFILGNKYSTIDVVDYLSFSDNLLTLRCVAKARYINKDIFFRLIKTKDTQINSLLKNNSSLEFDGSMLKVFYNNLKYRFINDVVMRNKGRVSSYINPLTFWVLSNKLTNNNIINSIYIDSFLFFLYKN